MNLNEFMEQVAESQRNHIKELSLLTEKSEARIERTNEIVSKLTLLVEKSQETLNNIAKEYSKHLDRLSECRNRLVEQNADLIRVHEQDLAVIYELRKRASSNTDRLYELLTHHLSISSSGVKVENKFQDKI